MIDDGLVLKGDRIVIPQVLRKEVLKAIHTGHQGETKCLLLARESVFWPGITNDIKKMVQECPVCAKHQHAQPRLPIMQPDLPTRAWQKLGTDIFDYDGKQYLIVTDYYSRYIIVRRLQNIMAETICEQISDIFMEFGLPESIIADCGTQYISEKFKNACKNSNVILSHSAPHHHQANSSAERSVGTVKNLWKKATELGQSKATALWMHRVTPLDDTLPSPSELLFGRKPKLFLPSGKGGRNEANDRHIEANDRRQEAQRIHYRAGVDKQPLNTGETVDVYNTIRKVWEPATVIERPSPIKEPRTYIVEKNGRRLFRTREHIKPRKAPMPPAAIENTGGTLSIPVYASDQQKPKQQQPTRGQETTLQASPVRDMNTQRVSSECGTTFQTGKHRSCGHIRPGLAVPLLYLRGSSRLDNVTQPVCTEQ